MCFFVTCGDFSPYLIEMTDIFSWCMICGHMKGIWDLKRSSYQERVEWVWIMEDRLQRFFGEIHMKFWVLLEILLIKKLRLLTANLRLSKFVFFGYISCCNLFSAVLFYFLFWSFFSIVINDSDIRKESHVGNYCYSSCIVPDLMKNYCSIICIMKQCKCEVTSCCNWNFTMFWLDFTCLYEWLI